MVKTYFNFRVQKKSLNQKNSLRKMQVDSLIILEKLKEENDKKKKEDAEKKKKEDEIQRSIYYH